MMFKVICVTGDYEFAIVMERAHSEQRDQSECTHYILNKAWGFPWEEWVKMEQAALAGNADPLFKKISYDDTIKYFSGMADGMGWVLPPKDRFETLTNVWKWLYEKRCERGRSYSPPFSYTNIQKLHILLEGETLLSSERIRKALESRPETAPFFEMYGHIPCKEGCVQSNAAWEKCFVCEAPIKTCAAPNGAPCPAHPNGVQLSTKAWVCGPVCWEKAADELTSA